LKHGNTLKLRVIYVEIESPKWVGSPIKSHIYIKEFIKKGLGEKMKNDILELKEDSP
jgi:hypothetical protein